jgi:transcriptional regulator with XRE-family HTH domain
MRVTVNVDVLEDIMRREKLTQADMCRRLDVDPSVMSRLMSGDRPGSPAMLLALQGLFPDDAQALRLEMRETAVTTKVATKSDA